MTDEQIANNLAVKQRANDAALRVYAFLVHYKKRHDGCSPTLRQIVERLALSSTSMAAYYLDMLEADKMIRRNDARGIEIVGACWLAPGEKRNRLDVQVGT